MSDKSRKAANRDMNRMLREERMGGAAMIGVLLVLCVGWYFGFVKPHEEALLDRAECSTEYQEAHPMAGPQEAWESCGR